MSMEEMEDEVHFEVWDGVFGSNDEEWDFRTFVRPTDDVNIIRLLLDARRELDDWMRADLERFGVNGADSSQMQAESEEDVHADHDEFHQQSMSLVGEANVPRQADADSQVDLMNSFVAYMLSDRHDEDGNGGEEWCGDAEEDDGSEHEEWFGDEDELSGNDVWFGDSDGEVDTDDDETDGDESGTDSGPGFVDLTCDDAVIGSVVGNDVVSNGVVSNGVVDLTGEDEEDDRRNEDGGVEARDEEGEVVIADGESVDEEGEDEEEGLVWGGDASARDIAAIKIMLEEGTGVFGHPNCKLELDESLLEGAGTGVFVKKGCVIHEGDCITQYSGKMLRTAKYLSAEDQLRTIEVGGADGQPLIVLGERNLRCGDGYGSFLNSSVSGRTFSFCRFVRYNNCIYAMAYCGKQLYPLRGSIELYITAGQAWWSLFNSVREGGR